MRPPHVRLLDTSDGDDLGRGSNDMEFSMNTAPLAVTQAVQLELIDPSGAVTPIDAQLHYDPRDPYAVTAVFMTGPNAVAWTFGRELLSSGLYEPCRDGDLHL